MTSDYRLHGLNTLAESIRDWRRDKGFHTPRSIEQGDMLLGKLMLVVTEVSEAAEAVRHGDEPNFIEEIADIFIRLLDLCGTMEIDIETAIAAKMTINTRRPKLHGKKTSL